MKTKVSIGLNIVLGLALLAMYVGHQLSDHYYREFTGLVLRRSAVGIEEGHSKRVGSVLNEVHGRPTYGELISIYEKLNREKPDGEGAVAPR